MYTSKINLLIVVLFLHTGVVFGLSLGSPATQLTKIPRPDLTKKTEVATFGMGCFWSPQQKFEEMKDKGVTRTYVGYTGGPEALPTYQSVCNGDGHVEAVWVEYDPNVISYDDLLDIFWSQDIELMKNPKRQYAPIIWTTSEQQREVAVARMQELEPNDDRSKLVSIEDAKKFYIAEEYHQHFWAKQNPRLGLILSFAVIDCWSNLPPFMYQASTLASIMFAGFLIWEMKFAPRKVLELEA